MSEWKDLVGKINSAKLGDKYIEDCLKGLVYRYYNDGDKACDSRNDPYGYATKYFNGLRDFLNDSEIDDIMYKPRIKYETKLKILIDYVCDAYGKNSTKESKESATKSLREEKEVWIIKSKDDLQYVGKKIFDVCEDIENARKFKSKFEAEEILKKHDKVLDYRYWKVINIISESKESVRKLIKESRVDKGAVVYAFNCMLNELGYLSYDYSNESNNEKCDEIVYMIMDLLKTMPKA